MRRRLILRRTVIAPARSARGRTPSVSKEKWVLITPEYAEELLKKRQRNRAISQLAVNDYLAEMTEGRWRPELPTTQPIVLDHKGQLVNGQHRIAAILLYGQPVLMRVAVLTRGVDIEQLRIAEAIVRPQRTSDIITAIDGKTNSTSRAAFVKFWLAMEGHGRPKDRIPVATQLAAIRANVVLFDEVIEICKRVKVSRIANAPFGGLFLWTSTGKHQIGADFRRFGQGYLDGIELPAGDPRIALRDYMMGPAYRHTDRIAHTKRIANAFHAFLEKREMQRASLSPDGFIAIAKIIKKDVPDWILSGVK